MPVTRIPSPCQSHPRLKKGAVKHRVLDFAEREGYIKGVVKAIVHESGRGAPLCKVQFHNAYKYKLDNELFLAAEGMYTGMSIYAGQKGVFFSQACLCGWSVRVPHVQPFI